MSSPTPYKISSYSQAFPPESLFDTDRDIPDLTGKIAAVTGGYGGIGYETSKALLKKNCTVYIFGRNEKLFDDALKLLSDQGVEQVPIFVKLDLAFFKSIKSAAGTFLSHETKLNYLFNSAGVMIPPTNSKTEDGYELQFGTNVIGHWLLTILLLPALQQAKGVDGQRARVVFTASSAADFFAPKGAINYDSLKVDEKGNVGAGVALWTLYGQSKIGDIIIANEFNRRYGDDIVFSSCNPGNLKTKLQRHATNGLFGMITYPLMQFILHPQWKGALTQLYAATSPEAENLGGSYFVPWARLSKARDDAEDPVIGKKLWEWLEEETKVEN